ncbi:collagen alpha-1(XII) chain [Nematostella vectensis]|uniref:collagen alpha-1(XII) chain n=1 Tax=Nematostella vectensis TaxID=45351 RepID=UPI0020773F52|nr:collagen alpha-1(XII) chain [Nematostella vectensis]
MLLPGQHTPPAGYIDSGTIFNQPFILSFIHLLHPNPATMIAGYSVLVFCAFLAIKASAQTCSSRPGYQWIKQGCRVDIHRSMTLLFDDRINFDDTDPNYLNGLVCRCMDAAITNGRSWFAIESLGMCFTKAGVISSHFSTFPLDPADNCYGPVLQKSNITYNGIPCVGSQFRAYFYNIQVPLASPPIEEPLFSPLEEPLLEEPLLCSKKADIAFYVDVSGSIGQNNLERVIAYILKFLDRFDFAQDKTRVAVVEYDVVPHTKLTLMGSGLASISDIREIVASQIRFSGKSTRTDLALKNAQNLFQREQRSGVPKTLVIITDGRSWYDDTLLNGAIAGIKALGVKTLAVAVGDDSMLELERLQSICETLDNVIKLGEYENLLASADTTLNKLVQTACVL